MEMYFGCSAHNYKYFRRNINEEYLKNFFLK